MNINEELLTLRRRIEELERQQLAVKGPRKKFSDAINDVKARPYESRKLADKSMGVKVFGFDQNLTEANKIDVGLENAFRIKQALLDGDPLALAKGKTYVSGGIKGVNTPLDLCGQNHRSVIVQMLNEDTFDFSMQGGYTGAFFVSNLAFEAGENTDRGKFALKLSPYTLGGETSGCISKVSVLRRNDLLASFGGGIWIDNPNEFVIDGYRYLGKLNSDAMGLKLTGTKANVSILISNTKIYDAIDGVHSVSSTIPGIEGIALYKVDTVNCKRCFHFESTSKNTLYLPPQLDINACHANVGGYVGGVAFNFVNYAQVNVSQCSAYLGAEGQIGYNLDTCSESKFSHIRAYNNSAAVVTGVRVGANNIYCNFIDVTGSVGENSTLIDFTEGSAFCKAVDINDLTANVPIKIHPDSQGNDIRDAFRKNTGRALFPSITGYEPNWNFRTGNEILYTRRYPADHPQFPYKLSVESRQPYLDAYTTGPDTVYWKLWESLPYTGDEAGGNRDLLHIQANIGRWESFQALGFSGRQLLEMVITTREGLSVEWDVIGEGATSGFCIYENEGRFSLYLVLSSPDSVQSATIAPINIQGDYLPRRLWPKDVDTEAYDSETGVAGTEEEPDGEKRFDSRIINGMFKPKSITNSLGRLERVKSAEEIPTTENIPEGYFLKTVLGGEPVVFYNVGGQIKRQSAGHIYVSKNMDGYNAIPDEYAGLVYFEEYDVFELIYKNGANVERLPLAPVQVTDGGPFFAGIAAGQKVPVVYTLNPRGWEFVSWATYAGVLKPYFDGWYAPKP